MLLLEQLKLYEGLGETALQSGADVLLKYWGKLQKIQQKGGIGNLVTEADFLSEKAIVSVLSQSKLPIIAEESWNDSRENSELFWAVDPLDGTANYVHRYPFAGISIALVYKNRPVIGFVCNPFSRETFRAVLGKGAFLNDQQIFVSSVSNLPDSLLATGFSYKNNNVSESCLREFCLLSGKTHGVRRGGSAALELCYTACGRLDGYWGRQLKIWDIAAGTLIIEEAGGVVTDPKGCDLDLFEGQILATNAKIHSQMISSLK